MNAGSVVGIPYLMQNLFELFALTDITDTKISHTTACALVCSGDGDTKPNILIVIMQHQRWTQSEVVETLKYKLVSGVKFSWSAHRRNILLLLHILAGHQYLYSWAQVHVPRIQTLMSRAHPSVQRWWGHKPKCTNLLPPANEVVGSNVFSQVFSFCSWGWERGLSPQGTHSNFFTVKHGLSASGRLSFA